MSLAKISTKLSIARLFRLLDFWTGFKRDIEIIVYIKRIRISTPIHIHKLSDNDSTGNILDPHLSVYNYRICTTQSPLVPNTQTSNSQVVSMPMRATYYLKTTCEILFQYTKSEKNKKTKKHKNFKDLKQLHSKQIIINPCHSYIQQTKKYKKEVIHPTQ